MPTVGVPSGTTQRLATLVGLATVSTVYLHTSLIASWPVDGAPQGPSCEVQLNAYVGPLSSASQDSAYYACLFGSLRWRLGWILAGLVVLATVSAAFYYTRPGRRIRRAGLQRLDELPGTWARLEQPLTALVARAGLSRPPQFWLDAVSPRAGGLAFGRGGKPLVCLDAGLVALVDRDRAAFDAIVLHELAHVRHRDVTTTFATLAVWRAFLLVGVLPYLAVAADPLLLSHDPWRMPPSFALASQYGAGVVGRLTVLVALIYVARTAVLRSR